MLGIRQLPQLLSHPLSGASWEGFALEQVLRIAQPDQAYFWATHQGAELDLLMFKDQQRIGVEFKRSDAPSLTPSMRVALHDLKLDRLYVVYPGKHRYALSEQVEVVPLTALLA
jgi:predicted AAA+ superfamily ATPase